MHGALQLNVGVLSQLCKGELKHGMKYLLRHRSNFRLDFQLSTSCTGVNQTLPKISAVQAGDKAVADSQHVVLLYCLRHRHEVGYGVSVIILSMHNHAVYIHNNDVHPQHERCRRCTAE